MKSDESVGVQCRKGVIYTMECWWGCGVLEGVGVYGWSVSIDEVLVGLDGKRL